MAYKYDVQYLPKEGMIFRRNRRSIRVGMMTMGQRLSDEQLASQVSSIMGLTANIEGKAQSTPTGPMRLRRDDFVAAEGDFYKYVPTHSWEYMQRGSFRFGSADEYRRQESPGIGDWREGLSFVSFQHQNDQASFTLRSGYNCALFCGTGHINGPDHARMMGEFSKGGGKLIKITPILDFMEKIKKRTRAFRARMHEAIYTDYKCFTIEAPVATDLRKWLNSEPALLDTNRMWFSTLYDEALLPSLFAKPAEQSYQRERRMVFELRDDLRSPAAFVYDRELLQYVEVVESFQGSE